jgi:transcriptional regulator with XRE-family HTH domain
MMKLARRLGLSQAEFARLIKESQQVVNNWRRRGAIPGRKLPKVAGALGVTVEELVTVNRPEEPGSYDLARLVRQIESQSPQDQAHFRWVLTRLLNRPS